MQLVFSNTGFLADGHILYLLFFLKLAMSQQLHSDYMLDPCLFLLLHKHLDSKSRDIYMLHMLRKPEDVTTSHT